MKNFEQKYLKVSLRTGFLNLSTNGILHQVTFCNGWNRRRRDTVLFNIRGLKTLLAFTYNASETTPLF